MMKTKILVNLLVIVSILSMLPSLSFSKELITGKIVGYHSLFYIGINPVDNQDPLKQCTGKEFNSIGSRQ